RLAGLPVGAVTSPHPSGGGCDETALLQAIDHRRVACGIITAQVPKQPCRPVHLDRVAVMGIQAVMHEVNPRYQLLTLVRELRRAEQRTDRRAVERLADDVDASPTSLTPDLVLRAGDCHVLRAWAYLTTGLVKSVKKAHGDRL